MEKKVNILIVDDEQEMLNVLKRYCERMPFVNKVIEAHSPFEGMNLIRQDKIDLVITDVFMGAVNGLEFLHHLKSQFKDLPVIVMTGFQKDNNYLRGLLSGMDDYLEKPFSLVDIERAIHKAIAFSGSGDLEFSETLEKLREEKLK